MRAGTLRHRVAIQSLGASLDDYGDPSGGWSTDATVWAAVEPVSGTESVIGDELTGVVTHKVTTRYRASVTPANRLTYDSRTLSIVEVRNWRERGIQLEIMCREVTT